MATFVLIPGGWHGGWAFAEFVARLQRAGHEAYAPTQIGLDTLPGAAPGSVNLDTHIDDVLSLACGHDVINAAPDAVMEILTEVASDLSS